LEEKKLKNIELKKESKEKRGKTETSHAKILKVCPTCVLRRVPSVFPLSDFFDSFKK
jgi:hypothetical protein